MMDPDGLSYDAETFPPGCVCADCLRAFRDGDRYSQRLLSVHDGAMLVEIVCFGCAVAPLESA